MADIYGSHSYIRSALRGIPRDEYAPVTKIWFRRGALPEEEHPPADVVGHRFLQELNTDYIDLVQLHCVTAENCNLEPIPQMDLLAQLKEAGKIRDHGVSCHSLATLTGAAEESVVDSVRARINAYVAKMDASPEEVVPLLQTIHQAGKGIIGMKLIGEGFP